MQAILLPGGQNNLGCTRRPNSAKKGIGHRAADPGCAIWRTASGQGIRCALAAGGTRRAGYHRHDPTQTEPEKPARLQRRDMQMAAPRGKLLRKGQVVQRDRHSLRQTRLQLRRQLEPDHCPHRTTMIVHEWDAPTRRSLDDLSYKHSGPFSLSFGKGQRREYRRHQSVATGRL